MCCIYFSKSSFTNITRIFWEFKNDEKIGLAVSSKWAINHLGIYWKDFSTSVCLNKYKSVLCSHYTEVTLALHCSALSEHTSCFKIKLLKELTCYVLNFKLIITPVYPLNVLVYFMFCLLILNMWLDSYGFSHENCL